MAEKKKVANKAEKKATAKKVDYSNLPEVVEVLGVKGGKIVPGKSYTVTKEIAQILLTKGAVKLA